MTHSDSDSMTHRLLIIPYDITTDVTMMHTYPCLLITYVTMTHTYEDRVICLFNTNILYQYINLSLPSLYGRLDFFHNHDIVSTR